MNGPLIVQSDRTVLLEVGHPDATEARHALAVFAELERIGVSYDWAGEAEVKCRCPFHDDVTPSCSVNVQKRMFVCHAAGCGEGVRDEVGIDHAGYQCGGGRPRQRHRCGADWL